MKSSLTEARCDAAWRAKRGNPFQVDRPKAAAPASIKVAGCHADSGAWNLGTKSAGPFQGKVTKITAVPPA